MSEIRQSVLSGTWYPGDPDELATQVDSYLANADLTQLPAGRPLIAVVPHAGYMYSGPTAGCLYGLLRGFSPRRIYILSPNHRQPLAQVALSSATAFATPLGEIKVATEAVARLAAHPQFKIDDNAHAQEHAVEIQLPLLQRTWPAAVPDIVPLLVPNLDETTALTVSKALTAELDSDSLLLVSTDFTHYGAAFGYLPFSEDIPEALETLDAGAILKILAGDATGLRSYGRETGITMCGLAATAVALDCQLPPGYEGALVSYRRSGDGDGDYSQSVSYASVLLCSGLNSTNRGL